METFVHTVKSRQAVCRMDAHVRCFCADTLVPHGSQNECCKSLIVRTTICGGGEHLKTCRGAVSSYCVWLSLCRASSSCKTSKPDNAQHYGTLLIPASIIELAQTVVLWTRSTPPSNIAPRWCLRRHLLRASPSPCLAPYVEHIVVVHQSTCKPYPFRSDTFLGRPIVLLHRWAILPLVRKRNPKLVQPCQRQYTQPHRQWFLRLQGPRHTASRQHHARQQRELDTIALSVLDAVAAEGVQGAD